MTIEANTRRVPRFGLGHRLALAREVAGLEQVDIAEAIDTSRATVSNYERGVSKPSRLQVNAWAVATGVDVEWLKTGKAQDEGGPRGGDGQPSDYKATVVPMLSEARRAA